MRRVTAIPRHRMAAVSLFGVGLVVWLLGAPLFTRGEAASTLRSAGVALVLGGCMRMVYLALLAQDQKYEEGHRSGFRLGRKTVRPVVVHMPRHAARGPEPYGLTMPPSRACTCRATTGLSSVTAQRSPTT